MKKIVLILVMSFIAIASKAQFGCGAMSLSVSLSGNTLVQLYHPGNYLIIPRSENVISWEITNKNGNIISQTSLVSDAFYNFDHNTPITDIMNVSSLLTNDYAKVACLIEDQICWRIREVSPGVFNGSWEILHNNVGVNVYKTLGINVLQPIILPADLKVIGYYDMTGRQMHSLQPNQIYIEVYNNGARRKILKRL